MSCLQALREEKVSSFVGLDSVPKCAIMAARRAANSSGCRDRSAIVQPSIADVVSLPARRICNTWSRSSMGFRTESASSSRRMNFGFWVGEGEGELVSMGNGALRFGSSAMWTNWSAKSWVRVSIVCAADEVF